MYVGENDAVGYALTHETALCLFSMYIYLYVYIYLYYINNDDCERCIAYLQVCATIMANDRIHNHPGSHVEGLWGCSGYSLNSF